MIKFVKSLSRGRWRRTEVLLMLMAAAVPLSFATWQSLLNNFAIERIAFTGAEMGVLQSLREVPGFLAFTFVFILLILKEQSFALISLALLGVGAALTGFFPSAIGLYCTTVLMSIGYHYYETAQQSLALQWLPKGETPVVLGRLLAVGGFASLIAYGLIFIIWEWLQLDYKWVYLAGGAITTVIALVAWLAFPQFEAPVPQRKTLVLRSRYWLYYALTFMGGARRQIFVVFAGFMMVEKFGYSVTAITLLFLVNQAFNMVLAPKIGGLIARFGERRALTFEYIGLIGIFVTYAFVEDATLAAVLYVIDHGFFALAIAMKTYFQKIADPADIAPTAGVAFSINHIAAVVIPAAFGLIWLVNPSLVFLLGAGMAAISLAFSRLIPTHPEPGKELRWHKPLFGAQPAD
ncbi:MFS transporter [Parvibaculum lavamentivorans]|nr:MFS transporter [Rhodobiaceae bacterium]MBN4051835.1 MFS transporter [Parvibaculum lavamentivorans]